MRSCWLIALTVLAACDDDVAPPPVDEGATLGAELAAQIAVDLAGATAEDATAVIGQILMTFDDGEVTLGVHARRRGELAEVTGFARQVVDAYAAQYDAASAFIDVRGIVAQDGRVSAALRDEALTGLAALDAAADFDAAYVSGQVSLHHAAVVLIDALVEQNRDPAFAVLLADAHRAVAEHGARAEALLRAR